MCRLCEIKNESTSPLGPVPEDVFKMVDFFAQEHGWAWSDHSLEENIQWAVQSLFVEGYIAISVSWAPDKNVKYHSRYDHQEELSLMLVPLGVDLNNIDPEEFMELAGKSTKESVQYLVDKLGLQGRVDVDGIIETMGDYGLEVVAPESDSPNGEPS